LRRSVTFRDFRALMACVNRIADLAEAEGHHPDFCVHYSQLDLELYTHAIGGLSENDFVLAAHLDALLPR
jgi:4a-hydroxytetrahydrobiopterin dehydratase